MCRSRESLQVAVEEILDSVGIFGGLYITDLRLVEVFEEEPSTSQVPGMRILMGESLANTFNELKRINETEISDSTHFCYLSRDFWVDSVALGRSKFFKLF